MIGLVHSTSTEKRQLTNAPMPPMAKVDHNCINEIIEFNN